ncbi:putative degenerin deg-1-like [Apostichopus japonicus]|uniref:Putative degenerin deg-1-like n=1 Tax=Stichopus japonicus TaxID=307972 RepID=A0A2G8KV35_STIJA|nr:putative degenerin deg-1-like [Apostichopus japonicus]
MTSITDREAQSLKGRFTNLLENTSAHGLGSIERAGNCGFRKVFWTVVFSFALTMFVLQLYYIGVEYISKDVSISVDIKYSRYLNFPAVTFCNLNPIKTSSLERSDRLNALLGSSGSLDSAQTDALSNNINDANTPPSPGEGIAMTTETVGNDVTAISMEEISTGDTVSAHTTTEEVSTLGMLRPPPRWTSRRAGYGDWTSVNYEAKNDDLDLLLQVTDGIARIPYSERYRLGHSIDDMLLSCTWKGFTCSPVNFTHFFNYKHGNCYTFNSGLNGTYEVSSKTGPLYGLTMEIYLEQTEYIPAIQQAAGLRLSIHDQKTMPFPEDNGISVSPGTETSVGVRAVQLTRLPDPYGDCVPAETTSSRQNIFTSFFGTNYTLESCEKNCLHENIVASCGCADTRFQYDTLHPPCLSTNDTQVACQEDVEAAYVYEELNCSCTNPCSERVYALTTSSAMWPNEQYKPTIVSPLGDVSADIKASIKTDEDFIQKNVLKLNVYFEHLNYESIEQSPAYTELDCLSDIGGQIGLWIGFSVITWFEFGEFLVDALIIIWKKSFRCGQQRKTTPTVREDADFTGRPIGPVFNMDREKTITDIVMT